MAVRMEGLGVDFLLENILLFSLANKVNKKE
jgi:hypothetical protein